MIPRTRTILIHTFIHLESKGGRERDGGREEEGEGEGGREGEGWGEEEGWREGEGEGGRDGRGRMEQTQTRYHFSYTLGLYHTPTHP